MPSSEKRDNNAADIATSFLSDRSSGQSTDRYALFDLRSFRESEDASRLTRG